MTKASFARWGTESSVALEGVFDKLVSLFKGSETAKQGNGAPLGKPARHLPYAEIQQVKKTYGNEAWVQQHLRETPHQSAKLSASLSFGNKLPATPAQALREAEKRRQEHLSKHLPAMRDYQKALNALDEEMQKLSDSGVNGADLFERGATLAKAIPLPFPAGTKIELHNGVVAEITAKGGLRFNQAVKPVSKTALPKLQAADVVEAAKAFLEITAQGYAPENSLFKAINHQFLGLAHTADFYDVSDNRDQRDSVDHDEYTHWTWYEFVPSEQFQMYGALATDLLGLSQAVGRWLYAACTDEATPSLEGIFDGLSKWFEGSVKGKDGHAGDARDPHRDGMGWAVNFRRDIMATYGSLAWVQKHLHAKQTVPGWLAYDLSYAGVQFASPALALAHAEKKVYEFHREHEAALLVYVKEVNKITSKKEEDFQKLKKPFPIGFKGPEFFGGKVPVVEDDYVVDEEIPLTGEQINAFAKMPPQLSAQDVVHGAQAIVALVPRLEQHLKDFYQKSGWQDAPVDAAQDSMVMEYTNLTLELCTDIGKWFYLITK